MKNEYTLIIKQEGDWWLGWVEEVSGVNCQEKSLDELMESLEDALKEALGFNRSSGGSGPEAFRAAAESY